MTSAQIKRKKNFPSNGFISTKALPKKWRIPLVLAALLLILGLIVFVYSSFNTARQIAFAKVSYQKGITALSASDYASAQNYFAAAAKADPKNSAYIWQLAITQTKNTKYQDAVNSYTKLIKLLPQSGIIYIQRGSANQMAGNFEAAKEDFNEAVILDKHNVTAYISLASLLNANGNKNEAVAVLNDGMLTNPSDTQISQMMEIINPSVMQSTKQAVPLKKQKK